MIPQAGDTVEVRVGNVDHRLAGEREPTTIAITVRPAKGGKYTASAAGLTIISRTPLCSMARALLYARRADPSTILEMVWHGTATVTMSGAAGALAQRTVREDGPGGPRIVRWKAPSFADVSRRSDECAAPAAAAKSTPALSTANPLADVSSSWSGNDMRGGDSPGPGPVAAQGLSFTSFARVAQ